MTKATKELLDKIENKPEEIIKWCRSEIEEYQGLIDMIEKKLLNNKETKS